MARLVRWLDIAIFLGFAACVLLTAPRESNWYAGLAVAAVCPRSGWRRAGSSALPSP